MSLVSDALRELADPSPPGDKIKTAIERAAKRCGLTYWRVFDIWYGKARRIEPAEIEAIEDALAKKREMAAKNELHELRLRITRLEQLMATKGADFYRTPLTDQLRLPLREVGGTDGNQNSAVD